MKIERFALERWMTTYETRVTHDIAESGICPLSTEDLLGLEPAAERDATLERLLDLPLGYSEARGTVGLRTALAETYANTSPDEILVTTGAIEANFLLLNVLLDPGDQVVVVDPAYQQVQSVPRAIGCDVALWRLRPENDFRFDLDELAQLVTSRTRMIVVNSPHNPTGALLSTTDLQYIYDLAASVDAVVLSDEAYRWLDIPGGPDPVPPMRNLGPRAISVGTLSKPFGLPGLRIGWIAGPADLVARCWGMRDFITLSPGKLDDALAILALKHRDRLIERNRAIIERNLAIASGWFAEHAELASWIAPRAGLLALLRYNFDLPSLDLANKLAEEYGVMLAPGSAFGYEGYMRLGIGQDPVIFAEGLSRTARCLRDLAEAGVPMRSDERVLAATT